MTATTLNSLLLTLTDSLKSAIPSLPEQSAIAPPPVGISLLDTKNELLLSYLQNLVFLIILKLRDVTISSTGGAKETGTDNNNDGHEVGNIREEIVKKLVELRVYLEKGVKPLEGRLRYQIDKVVRAAEEDASKNVTGSQHQARLSNGKASGRGSIATNGHKRKSGSESDDSEASSASGNSDEDTFSGPAIDPLAYRPNPSAMTLPTRSTPQTSKSKSDNIYRPPRIAPTALPTTTSQRSTSTTKRPSKSATLDEFVATELSTAPIAEPSIGSTIVDRGRRSKSAKEREIENERSRYEESNYVRLPTEGKKKKGRAGKERNEYGGEEWRGLGEGAERVVGLTRKGSSSGGALERSRKRAREDSGGGGGGGEVRMGERFEKRRQGLEKRRPGRR